MAVEVSTSETALVNRALGLLGEGALITDFESDTSQAGQRARVVFWDCWHEVLEDYPWDFATGRWSIAAHSTDPLFGFEKQYMVPPDCVKVRDLYDAYSAEDWRVETFSDGTKVILTNISAPLRMLGTRAETNIGRASPLFRKGFAARLAAELAMTLTNSRSKLEDMVAIYRAHIAEAQRSDAQQGGPDMRDEGSWVGVREAESAWPPFRW